MFSPNPAVPTITYGRHNTPGTYANSLSSVSRTPSRTSSSGSRFTASEISREVDRISAEYVQRVIDELIFEEVMDFIWDIKTGEITADDIYGLKPISSYYQVQPAVPQQQPSSSSKSEKKPHQSSSSVVSSSSYGQSVGNQMTTKCPICHESVAATRFAIHLEKCMNGGKRGSKRHYDYIRDDVYLNKTTKPKKEIIDPHPDSFIVKVKLRNGVPAGNTKRIGAPLEEFLAVQEENKK